MCGWCANSRDATSVLLLHQGQCLPNLKCGHRKISEKEAQWTEVDKKSNKVRKAGKAGRAVVSKNKGTPSSPKRTPVHRKTHGPKW